LVAATGRGRASVLVVDDDVAIRTGIAELLREEGYQVTCAENGEQAMHALCAGPHTDLVLLDLMMPVMSGWEVIEALRESQALQCIPIVTVSALNAPGCAGHIAKPIDVGHLLATVARLTR
jgi:CheY-like chemotaxis protein